MAKFIHGFSTVQDAVLRAVLKSLSSPDKFKLSLYINDRYSSGSTYLYLSCTYYLNIYICRRQYKQSKRTRQEDENKLYLMFGVGRGEDLLWQPVSSLFHHFRASF